VNLALDRQIFPECERFDGDADCRVSIDELVRAVARAQAGDSQYETESLSDEKRSMLS
jgi:hypothetical protein